MRHHFVILLILVLLLIFSTDVIAENTPATIGTWKIVRDANGIARKAEPEHYTLQGVSRKIGNRTIEGSASFYISYGSQYGIHWVAIVQESIRTVDPTESRAERLVPITMAVDGKFAVQIPSPEDLDAMELERIRKSFPPGARPDPHDLGMEFDPISNQFMRPLPHGRNYTALINEFVEYDNRQFQKQMLTAKTVRFQINAENETFILAEFSMDQTNEVVDYLRRESMRAAYQQQSNLQ